jgi:hypothetical protein
MVALQVLARIRLAHHNVPCQLTMKKISQITQAVEWMTFMSIRASYSFVIVTILYQRTFTFVRQAYSDDVLAKPDASTAKEQPAQFGLLDKKRTLVQVF